MGKEAAVCSETDRSRSGFGQEAGDLLQQLLSGGDTEEIAATLNALYRRLNRETAARKEAENLLHSKAHSLAEANAKLEEQASLLRGELFQSKEQLRIAQNACKFSTLAYDIADGTFESTGDLAGLLGFEVSEEPSILEMLGRVESDQKNALVKQLMEMTSKNPDKMNDEDRIFEGVLPILLPDGTRKYLEGRLVRMPGGLIGREILYGAIQDVTSKHELANAMQITFLDATKKQSELEETVGALRDQRDEEVETRRVDINGFMQAIQKVEEVVTLACDAATSLPEQYSDTAGQVLLAKDICSSVDEYMREKFFSPPSVERDADVFHLANELVNEFRDRSSNGGHDFELNNETDLDAKYRLDVTRVQKALRLMLDNAVDASDKGSITLSITEPERDLLLFVIEDQGRGIADSDCDRIFEEFVRIGTDDVHASGHIGLGLSQLKLLAQSLGGSVSMSSKLGVGTRFELLVPAARRSRRGVASKDPVVEYGEKMTGETQRKILLVEDDLPNEIVARKMLEQYGCDVDSARTGEEALRKVNLNRYDLILLDVRLPGIDGLEVARSIRSRTDDRASIPLLAVTAHVFADEIQQCFDAGVDEVFSKPIFKEELFDTLDTLFGQVDKTRQDKTRSDGRSRGSTSVD